MGGGGGEGTGMQKSAGSVFFIKSWASSSLSLEKCLTPAVAMGTCLDLSSMAELWSAFSHSRAYRVPPQHEAVSLAAGAQRIDKMD